MRRVYVSTADFRAPLDPVDFQGLGQARQWPARRSYWSTANFRAPYDDGYFQNNQLFGVPSVDMKSDAPDLVRRYLVSGEPVPTTLRDVSIPFNQVNRWVYAGVGALTLFLGYRAYKQWKKQKGPATSGQS